MNKSKTEDFSIEIIQEGKSKLIVPKLQSFVIDPSEYAPSRAPVFYNPVMELNRDISIIAFQVYQQMMNQKISICEPLTGTGIKGVRFANEIYGVKEVLSGDINKRSVDLAEQNISFNELEKRMKVKHKDANRLLSEYGAPRKRFNIIDIDPFGTPVPYLDSAIRALRHKGLLAATATDMAPLCGVHAKACLRKYGGKPLRTEYCQELAVRLLAGCITTTAARHEIGTQVLFSHCNDHYIRVYTRITYGAQKADQSIKKMGYILHCFNCMHRETANKPFTSTDCPECGAKMDYAGPLWIDEIFDRQFCEDMLKEEANRQFKKTKQIRKILTNIRDEAKAPLTYYVLDRVSQKLGLPVPSVAAFKNKLQTSGFEVFATHFNPRGLRINSSSLKIQELMKELVESQQQET